LISEFLFPRLAVVRLAALIVLSALPGRYRMDLFVGNLRAQAAAYDGLKLGGRHTVHDPHTDKAHFEWKIEDKPSDYLDSARDVSHERIKLAGYRLAMLLKAIWP